MESGKESSGRNFIKYIVCQNLCYFHDAIKMIHMESPSFLELRKDRVIAKHLKQGM